MLWDRKWCDNKFLIGGLMFMVKANFGHSDFKLVCCFPQGKAVLTYIRKYFKTWTESWQFFRSCQLWSCASKWPPHSPLLSVKCLHCLCLLWHFFFLLNWRSKKVHHSYSTSVSRLLYPHFLLLFSPLMIEAFSTNVCETWAFRLRRKLKSNDMNSTWKYNLLAT